MPAVQSRSFEHEIPPPRVPSPRMQLAAGAGAAHGSAFGRWFIGTRRVVVVAPRVIVVERTRYDRRAEWTRFGYRPVYLYYVDGRYFERSFNRAGVRQVVVYERGGRYYRECDPDDRYDRDRHQRARHGHDRYNWDD